jgi:hypothetical protein
MNATLITNPRNDSWQYFQAKIVLKELTVSFCQLNNLSNILKKKDENFFICQNGSDDGVLHLELLIF